MTRDEALVHANVWKATAQEMRDIGEGKDNMVCDMLALFAYRMAINYGRVVDTGRARHVNFPTV